MANRDFGGVAADAIRVRAQVSHSFFAWMAVVMLAITLVGFSPTYFLGAWFRAPAVPLHVHVHVALFMSWFVLLLTQTILVARGQLSLHRRLGAAGAGLAALIVPVTMAVIYFSHSRRLSSGGSEGDVASQLFGQLGLLAAYTIFVSCAIAYRRRADPHKRFMLLASLTLMPFPLGRFGNYRLLDIGTLGPAVYGLGGLVVLLLFVVVYDLMTRGAIHPVIGWGGSILVGSILFIGLVVPQTEFARMVVRLIW